MNHPELLAVPVLMLGDYFFTIAGAKSSAGVHSNHFKNPSYELNPLWRESVDQLRWFNPRHLALVAFITGLLWIGDRIISTSTVDTESAIQILEVGLGTMLGVLGSLTGRHLTNLLIFRFLNRNSEEISGQVHLSMKLLLKMSQYSHIGQIPVFAMLAFLAPGTYSIGFLSGILLLAAIHYLWLFRANA